jgi:hypothetical protein
MIASRLTSGASQRRISCPCSAQTTHRFSTGSNVTQTLSPLRSQPMKRCVLYSEIFPWLSTFRHRTN